MVHLVDLDPHDAGASRRTPSLHAGGPRQFMRFCGVGGVGFLVDAGLLMVGIHALGLGPIEARLLSAGVAILATFELNRRWAFVGAGPARYWPALAAYVGVQGVGLLCNVAVYTGCTLLLPDPMNAPLPCLAVASGTALLVNYAGVSRLVFRPGVR